MKGTFKLGHVENVEATLAITMTVSDWRALYETLKKAPKYPDWKVGYMVRDLLNQADQTLYTTAEKEVDI